MLLLGVAAFAIGTASGVLMAKGMNLVFKRPINPLIGAAGVSAVPMAARVVSRVGPGSESRQPVAHARHGAERRGRDRLDRSGWSADTLGGIALDSKLTEDFLGRRIRAPRRWPWRRHEAAAMESIWVGM